MAEEEVCCMALGYGRKKEIDASLDCNAACHAIAAHMLHSTYLQPVRACEAKLPTGKMVRQRLDNDLLETGLQLVFVNNGVASTMLVSKPINWHPDNRLEEFAPNKLSTCGKYMGF